MTRKRTFSLPDDVSRQLDQVAGSNASAYVAEALRDRIARDAAATRIRQAYGPIDPDAYSYWVQRLSAEPAAIAETGDPEAGATVHQLRPLPDDAR